MSSSATNLGTSLQAALSKLPTGYDKFGTPLQNTAGPSRTPNPHNPLGRSDEEQLRAQQNLKNLKNWWHRVTQDDDASKNVQSTKPILLDLDSDGIELTELDRSTEYMDSEGTGLKNRTAWAGAGDGVLFYDADSDGTISDDPEYTFTEWAPNPSATGQHREIKGIRAETIGALFSMHCHCKWALQKRCAKNANTSGAGMEMQKIAKFRGTLTTIIAGLILHTVIVPFTNVAERSDIRFFADNCANINAIGQNFTRHITWDFSFFNTEYIYQVSSEGPGNGDTIIGSRSFPSESLCVFGLGCLVPPNLSTQCQRGD